VVLLEEVNGVGDTVGHDFDGDEEVAVKSLEGGVAGEGLRNKDVLLDGLRKAAAGVVETARMICRARAKGGEGEDRVDTVERVPERGPQVNFARKGATNRRACPGRGVPG
jgi:hypothetical protein